jgi:glycosyltransferase involved in cell wall biosynthesis
MSCVVSIIMSMRNAAPTVGQTIRSLQWQSLRDWELVLFDDGSRDGCADIVRAFGDPRIRLFCEMQSRGLATRLNQAVALAQGRFIARMDADDICFPERLARQVAFLEAHPQVDVLATRAAVFADDGHLTGVLPVGVTHAEIVANPLRGFSFAHPTWCGRAEWFRANPYDSSLSKTQDQDLLLRSYRHSRFAGLPDILLGYRQDRLDIRKLLRGRFIFARSVWWHAGGSALDRARGVAMQAAKAGIDLGMSALLLDAWAQRQRLLDVPPSLREEWSALWTRLQAGER